jgi:hypothetical protein
MSFETNYFAVHSRGVEFTPSVSVGFRPFRSESAFTIWLHRLTVNQVLMHFRKPSVKSELTTNDGEIPQTLAAFGFSMRFFWFTQKNPAHMIYVIFNAIANL